jgi:hypothetical protein
MINNKLQTGHERGSLANLQVVSIPHTLYDRSLCVM